MRTSRYFYHFLIIIILLSGIIIEIQAQYLYTADGYWIEFRKEIYQDILLKKSQGDDLTVNETNFLLDYGAYLQQYFSRLSEDEKLKVEELMQEWEYTKTGPAVEQTIEDFDLRTRDRLVNGIYGAYYGFSIVAIAELEGSGLAGGLPLIMAGIWQLGPVINKKKYEDISLATIRAGNTGKFLGAGYGAALGLAVAGDSYDNYKWVLGLSTVGSITLGEIAFQGQKRKNLSLGHVEMIRHYGFLGPITLGLTSLAVDFENPRLIGASLFVGGIGGMLLGNRAAKKYDYTQGDVDAISSLTLITAGLGGTIAIGSIDDGDNTGLLVIPAITAVAGTFFGQKAVKGVKLTKKQGSTIKIASGGAALIGLGAVVLTQSDAPAWYVGTSSVCALLMHQLLFNSYKKKNFENNLNLGESANSRMQFTLNVNPENYLVNKRLSRETMARNPSLSYPIVKFKLRF